MNWPVVLLEHATETQGLEILVWVVPAVLGFVLTRRAPRGARAGWCLVALATSGFALDKAVDLHAVLYGWGLNFVHWVDPETHLRGSNVGLRALLLGGLFLGGVLGGRWLLRFDKKRAPEKLLSLLGLVVVMGYLGLRLMPQVGGILEWTVVGWLMEALAWFMVVTGEVIALRRKDED